MDIKSILEKSSEKLNDLSQKLPDDVGNKIVSTVNSKLSTAENIKFCSNCGTKLNEGAKFCHGCGVAVGAVVQQQQAAQTSPPIVPEEKKSERQQEYVGKILKCPNCGAIISETTAICPDCGMQITGRTAVSSVQAFQEQLMNIELSRKKSKFMDVYTQAANPADTQKLSLIRSFPIPNTVADIQEFMLLAVANIDVQLSKNSVGGKLTNWMNSGNINLKIQKTISDAWVAKMQQSYQKAEMLFSDEDVFGNIQKIYFDKIKELKIKVD